jgi:hypothetical protein
MSCQNSIERRQPSASRLVKLTLNSRVEQRLRLLNIAPGGTPTKPNTLGDHTASNRGPLPRWHIIAQILELAIEAYNERLLTREERFPLEDEEKL